MRDRDVRLGDRQLLKIEEMSRAKERTTKGSGSEVASLELKLTTAIKDNSELLKANRWVWRLPPALFLSSCFFSILVPVLFSLKPFFFLPSCEGVHHHSLVVR